MRIGGLLTPSQRGPTLPDSFRPRLAVLVGGDRASPAANRARQLLGELGDDCEFHYRSRGRVTTALRYIAACIRSRPRTIYVMDSVVSTVAAAAVLRIILKCRVIIDTGDATYALARSSGRVGSLALAALWMVERLAHSIAQPLIVRGRYHYLFLTHRGHHDVVQIPDCVAIDSIDDDALDSTSRRLRNERRLEEKFTVGFVGTCTWNPRLGICYGWDLVEAMALLASDRIHGVVIGDGDGVPHLRARARALGVEHRITFIPRVPRQEVDAYVRILDVCLSTQTDDLVGWVRTSGKLPLYLANQRAVIATDVGEASWVLPPHMRLSYSGVVDPAYPGRLAQRLEELVSIHADRPVVNTREIAARYFDEREARRSVLRVLGRDAEFQTGTRA